MTNDHADGWFIVFPFLTKASGKIIVTIARMLRLSHDPQLVSNKELLQLVLDAESARQLLAIIKRAAPDSSDSAMHYLTQKELREFIASSENCSTMRIERECDDTS